METGVGEITVDDNSRVEHHCSYCGAQLNFSFYFCLSCATPYKSISDVISPYIPPQPTESELIHKKAPNVWRVFWTYAILLFAILLLRLAMSNDESARNHIIVVSSVCMVLTTIVVGLIYLPSLVVQLKRPGIFQRHMFYGLLLLAGLLILNYVYHGFLVYFEPDLNPFRSEFKGFDGGYLSSFLILCLVPGLTEEIAYRGLIQHWLQAALKPWWAIILTSALFTAMHLSVLSAPYLFLLGLLLGWLKYKTGSLYPSMIVHILHNYIVVTIFPLLESMTEYF